MSQFKLVLLLFSFFFVFSVSAKGGGVWPYDNANEINIKAGGIKYIYDGDTFYIFCKECKKGKVAVRVVGTDTPEIKGKCLEENIKAREAKQFVVEKLRNAKAIKLVKNESQAIDRYGRLLAHVYVDGKNLASLINTANLGYEYLSGKKRSWCDK